MKHLATVIPLILGLLPAASAQTCSEYIAQGRSLLHVSNVVEANARFASAVALCPANDVARFYHAATALAALPFRPAPSNFLDRIGLPHRGRDLYHWTAQLPRDTNGHFIVPAGLNATEAVALLRNEILPVITSAGLDLAQITSPGFAVPISYEETKLADVIVDYGDVLLLRAGLHALEFWAYSLSSWNLDVHLQVLEQLEAADELSIERVLRDFPQLLTFASTNELAAAKTAFENAVVRYLEGSAFIRARPANLVRLFNYDLEQASREERFRCTLVDLRNSLQEPTVLCVDSNYVVYLANYFSGHSAPRGWLPRFARNDIEINSFPDLTFGGVVGGLSEPAVEDLLSQWVDLAPAIRNAGMPSAGRFTCEFPTLPDRIYNLEFSSDLRTWSVLVQFASEGGTYAFIDGGARNAPYRYYRLTEVFRFVTIRGEVRDACSQAPIGNALVTTGSGESATTDHAGRFAIRFFSSSGELNLSAPNYFGVSRWISREDKEVNFNLISQLALRPLNSDWDGRLRLTGLPATLDTANCGADQSPDFEPWLGYYPVWFTWTAPISGVVAIQAAGIIEYPLVSVFTGATTNNLGVVASGFGEVRFPALAGTTYHISVGGWDYQQAGKFTLRISAPPALNWSAPADGAEFTAPTTIVFEINPVDSDGNLTEARYYANGEWIGQATTPPYGFTWENVPAGLYRFEVRMRDALGLVTSEQRQVAVRPPNDNFAYRIPLQGAPLRIRGSNKAATLEPGEPPHVGHSVWWSWRTPSLGFCTIIAEGAESDDRNPTLLAVYTGSPLSQLSPIVSKQSLDSRSPVQVSFVAEGQTEYQIVVGGTAGDDTQLRVLPTAAPQVVIINPASGTRFLTPINISVQAAAVDADNNLSSIELYASGYLLHASTINPVSFLWTNVPVGNYTLSARAIDSFGATGISSPVSVEVRAPPPPNDNFADRIRITGTAGRLVGTTEGATKEFGEPNVGSSFSSNSVWWTWTAPAAGWLSLRDVGPRWYKRLHVFTGNSVSALASVEYEDWYTPWIEIFVQSGMTYHISVEGRYDESGTVAIDLQFNPL